MCKNFFPKCKLCDSDNSRKHVTNECATFNKLRDETIKKLSYKLEIKDKNIDLKQLILRLYYDPRETDHQDTHEIIKDFATEITKIYGMAKDKKNEQESDYEEI